MKKFTATSLGGAPVDAADLKKIFNDDLYSAIEGILSPFSLTTEGIIVSGCIISGGGPYNISAGVVYLNGEFMALPAQTGVSLPQYIQPDTVVSDTRTFADSTTHEVASTKSAKVGGSAPGSGQYIAITSVTDPDNQRLIQADGKLMVGLDTGWQTITLTNGWVAGSDVPKWRRIGSQVFLRGTVVGTGASNVLMCTGQLPSAGYIVGLTAHRLNVTTVEIRDVAVNTSGGLTSSDYANSTVLYLDGLIYQLGS
jgi:hypothetical protein